MQIKPGFFFGAEDLLDDAVAFLFLVGTAGTLKVCGLLVLACPDVS